MVEVINASNCIVNSIFVVYVECKPSLFVFSKNNFLEKRKENWDSKGNVFEFRLLITRACSD